MTTHLCSSCNAPIVWLKTRAGKSMPTDAGSVQGAIVEGKTIFNTSVGHVSHYETCPHAAQHRRRPTQHPAMPRPVYVVLVFPADTDFVMPEHWRRLGNGELLATFATQEEFETVYAVSEHLRGRGHQSDFFGMASED